MGWIRASERVENLLTFQLVFCVKSGGVHYEARYELWECVTRLNNSPITTLRYEVAARNDPVTITRWLVTTS